MKNIIKHNVGMILLLLSSSAFAWSWHDLWQTPDQQGVNLLHAGKAKEASQVFKNKEWRAVAQYRAGNYAEALQQFASKKTSDGQYNAGNAEAYLGHYQEAINAYDKAIALNSNNTDAVTNREIIKKLMEKKQQQQQQPQQNNSSANNKKDTDKDKNNNEKQSGQNNKQKNSPDKPDQQAQANQPEQKPASNTKQKNEPLANASQSQNQDEDKKQLLRRLGDDPGSLLQQKFLRDYSQRHTAGAN